MNASLRSLSIKNQILLNSFISLAYVSVANFLTKWSLISARVKIMTLKLKVIENVTYIYMGHVKWNFIGK